MSRDISSNAARAWPDPDEKTLIERPEPASELDKFVYIVSHDLRNCARAITEVPQWLRDDMRDQGMALTEDMRENFDLLDRHARRLDRMLLDLLIFSRVGRLQEVETFALDTLLDEVLAETNLPDHVSVTLGDNLPYVKMGFKDAFVLVKCVLDNVITHGSRRGTRLHIDASAQAPMVTLSFTDTGPGIPSADLLRAFEPMTTLRRRDEVEGSGMGLAILHRIAMHYGGDVWAGPGANGRGLTIDVSLNVGITI